MQSINIVPYARRGGREYMALTVFQSTLRQNRQTRTVNILLPLCELGMFWAYRAISFEVICFKVTPAYKEKWIYLNSFFNK